MYSDYLYPWNILYWRLCCFGEGPVCSCADTRKPWARTTENGIAETSRVGENIIEEGKGNTLMTHFGRILFFNSEEDVE